MSVEKPCLPVECAAYGKINVPLIHGYKHVGSFEGQSRSYKEEIACRKNAANIAIKFIISWFHTALPQKGRLALLQAFVISVLFMNLSSFSKACSFAKLEIVYSRCLRLALKRNGKDAPINVSNLVYLNYRGMFSFGNMLRFRRLSYFVRVLEHSP